MKRKTVFSHRTVKMREDFLDWARRQKAARRQAERDQLPQSDPTLAPGLLAWADDGGALPRPPDDTQAETDQ